MRPNRLMHRLGFPRTWMCALMLLLVLTAAGCAARKVYRLTDKKFASTPASQEIKLYVNEVQRPHVKIAHVESFSERVESADIKRDQLQDLTKRARSLGADAIINIRQMRNNVRGVVVDEAVPFRAYRQGEYELVFLRGTAIKFTGDESATEEEGHAVSSHDSIPHPPMRHTVGEATSLSPEPPGLGPSPDNPATR